MSNNLCSACGLRGVHAVSCVHPDAQATTTPEQPVSKGEGRQFAKWCYRNAEYIASSPDWKKALKDNAKIVLEAAGVKYVD